jgi:hypothetical protein
MLLIVYTSPADNSASLLQHEISKMPFLQAEFIHNHDNLIRSLRSRMVFQSVIVFQAADQNDFLFLESIRNLLFDARLILILPDREKDTIDKGLSLSPRYMTYSNGNYKDVVAVLEKMLKICSLKAEYGLYSRHGQDGRGC